SDIRAIYSSTLEGLSCLSGRKPINAVGIAVDDRRVSFRAKLRSEFVAVVVFDPAHIGVKGRALSNLIRSCFRTDSLHPARSIGGEKPGHRREELVFDTTLQPEFLLGVIVHDLSGPRYRGH